MFCYGQKFHTKFVDFSSFFDQKALRNRANSRKKRRLKIDLKTDSDFSTFLSIWRVSLGPQMVPKINKKTLKTDFGPLLALRGRFFEDFCRF